MTGHLQNRFFLIRNYLVIAKSENKPSDLFFISSTDCGKRVKFGAIKKRSSDSWDPFQMYESSPNSSINQIDTHSFFFAGSGEVAKIEKFLLNKCEIKKSGTMSPE
jgi:hypothetical protein